MLKFPSPNPQSGKNLSLDLLGATRFTIVTASYHDSPFKVRFRLIQFIKSTAGMFKPWPRGQS